MKELKSLEAIRKEELLGYWYRCVLAMVLLLVFESSLLVSVGSWGWFVPPVCFGRVFLALAALASPFICLIIFFAKSNLDFRQLAMFDELTGLGSLRYLRQEVPRLLATARRQQVVEHGVEPLKLHLFFVDMDGLKRINDAPGLGHLCGDMAIKGAAKALSLTFKRADDVLARIGGDEFVIAVIAGDLEDQVIMGRFYSNLAEVDREIVRDAGYKLGLAASIGYKSGPVSEEGVFERLLKEADAAMYENKQARKAASQKR